MKISTKICYAIASFSIVIAIVDFGRTTIFFHKHKKKGVTIWRLWYVYLQHCFWLGRFMGAEAFHPDNITELDICRNRCNEFAKEYTESLVGVELV